MRLRMNVLLVAALALVISSGCEDPKEIVPVAPPGFELTRSPATTQGEAAQALGEQGPSSSTAATPKRQRMTPELTFNSPSTPVGQPTKTASGLTYETLKPGEGRVAQSGDSVKMHYTGTLDDGTKFDSSVDRNMPLPVTLGMRQVIAGWDEGIPGMKVGEKRKLVIPADLAYGDQANGKIPAKSRLTFDVELISIDNE